MKRRSEQIQTATHEQLRVWVAEELGYVWWKRCPGSYIGLLAEDTAVPDYWVKVPSTDFSPVELDGDLPDWPNSIGQAWELLDDLEALDYYWDMATEFHAKHVTVIAPGADFPDGIYHGIAKTMPAAICKAWLMAKGGGAE